MWLRGKVLVGFFSVVRLGFGYSLVWLRGKVKVCFGLGVRLGLG